MDFVNVQDTPGASALDALRLASGAGGDASNAPPADPFTAAAKSSFDAPWCVTCAQLCTRCWAQAASLPYWQGYVMVLCPHTEWCKLFASEQ